MTLLDRVRAAGNETPAASRATRDEMLEWLKERVREQLPADDIASLAKGNPERARNEIRAVCRAAFEGSGRFDTGLAEREALADTLIDSMLGFGPLEPFLADESITEIMVNGSRSLFYERDGVLHQSEFCFASDDEVRMLIDRIIGPLGRRIDESSPMVNARLAQGHRVNAIVPPLALDGPMLTIRTFSSRVITLQDMMESGSIEECVQRLLVWAVRARKSIAVSGGTGSGKTTLLNALSCHVPPDERIITIEDSAELRFLEHPHVVRLEARPRNAEGVGEVAIRDLVANALRMRPDRIIVGECRGAEALDMLQAMNTGHDGSLTTAHANNPRDALARLENMVMMAGFELPSSAIREQIAAAIDLIVQQTRLPDGSRKIVAISEVTGREADVILLQDIFTFEQEGFDERGRVVGHHTATGNIPYFVDELRKSGNLKIDMSVFVPKT